MNNPEKQPGEENDAVGRAEIDQAITDNEVIVKRLETHLRAWEEKPTHHTLVGAFDDFSKTVNSLLPASIENSENTEITEHQLEKTKTLVESLSHDLPILGFALQYRYTFGEALILLNRFASSEPSKIQAGNISDLRAAAISMIESKLDIISDFFEGKETYPEYFFSGFEENKRNSLLVAASFETLLSLFNGTDEQKETALTLLEKHVDHMNNIEPGVFNNFLSTVNGIYKKRDILPDHLKERIDSIIYSNAYDHKAKKVRAQTILDAFFNPTYAQGLVDVAESITCDIAKSYGLNPEESTRIWRATATSGDYLERNFETMEFLEREQPGSVSILNKDFGVLCFGRYPKEMLLRQFNMRNDDKYPYGIVISPKNDNNSTFFDYSSLLEPIDKLKDLYELRAIEVEDKLDIAKIFRMLQKRYHSHKITFAFVRGHGYKYGISFGLGKREEIPENRGKFLHSEDIDDPRFENYLQYFEDSPTFILSSCNTGRPGGIAENFSKKFNANIIAPTKITPIDSIETRIYEGKPTFLVKYRYGRTFLRSANV